MRLDTKYFQPIRELKQDVLYLWRCRAYNIPISNVSWHLFNNRVSTDLTEQISRRFPGYSRRDFKKKSRTCLHCFGPICNVPNELYLMEHVMMSSNAHHCAIQPTITQTMPHHQFSIITQKFPGGPFKFQEISRISRSCRHPVVEYIYI